MTLTQFEASLLTTASPALPRGQATACAGAAYDARRLLADGIAFATVITQVTANPRHWSSLQDAEQLSTFQGLSGP